MNPKSLLSCLLGITLAGIPAAHATLAITNGNFETGAPPADSPDVLNWNDANPGGFWQAAWLKKGGDSPNGSTVMCLSANAANETLNGVGTNTYAYQAIGTRAGANSVTISFQWGTFATAPPRSLGITVGIYESDGTFVPADGTELLGASGVTLVDQESILQTAVPTGTLYTQLLTFDLSGAGTGQLYLRFNNYEAPGKDEAWVAVDNVLIVPPTPVFTLQPKPVFGNVGSNVVLTAAVTSNPAPAYQWQYSADGLAAFTNVTNGGNVSGAATPTLSIISATYAQAGYYRVIADNGTTPTNSDEVFVSISYPNPTISLQPQSAPVAAGGNFNLSVTATGLGNLSYKWFKVNGGGDIELTNGGDISGATTASLQISNVAAADAGGYYVVVSDDASVADLGDPSASTSATATLVIADVPVTASATAPATDVYDQSYLPGNVDDVDNIDGTGVNPLTNDASTYASFDRASQGMTFTTGTDPLGYSIQSVTVRMVQVINYLTNGTFYNIQPGDTFEFQFGSVTGGVKTPIFDTNGALYSGAAMANPAPPANTGAGNYLTFNLATVGIGTLAPNTTYYFEINAELGAPFFELSGTKADGYAGGTAFRGNTIGTIDANYVALTGDRAFHADLTGLSGPANTYASWIATYPGVGALTGFNDDADGDGIDNGLENLFGTNPSVSSQGITQVAKSGNTITFQHPANASPAGDVSAAYVWSTDLATFHADGATVGGTTVAFSTTTQAGTITVTATITGTVPAKVFTAFKAVKAP